MRWILMLHGPLNLRMKTTLYLLYTKLKDLTADLNGVAKRESNLDQERSPDISHLCKCNFPLWTHCTTDNSISKFRFGSFCFAGIVMVVRHQCPLPSGSVSPHGKPSVTQQRRTAEMHFLVRRKMFSHRAKRPSECRNLVFINREIAFTH